MRRRGLGSGEQWGFKEGIEPIPIKLAIEYDIKKMDARRCSECGFKMRPIKNTAWACGVNSEFCLFDWVCAFGHTVFGGVCFRKDS